MNPPYDLNSHGDQLYVKFINKVILHADKAVIISPDNAFLNKTNKNKDLKLNINKFKPELIIGDWKDFDAHPTSKSCISIWNILSPNSKIKIGNSYFDKQEDIITCDSSYVKEFYDKLVEYFKTHKSLYDVCVANPKNSQYFDPNGRTKIKDTWPDKTTWFTVMPYCIASHFTTFGYEKYTDSLWNGPARILIPFKNENLAKNCYITIQDSNNKKGDLNVFYKLISNVLASAGYIKSVDKYKYFPYLNFNKIYSTEELFSLIGMKYDEDKINDVLN